MKDELLEKYSSFKIVELGQITGGKSLTSSCKVKHNAQDTTHDVDYDDGSGSTSDDHTWFGDVMDVLTFWD